MGVATNIPAVIRNVALILSFVYVVSGQNEPSLSRCGPHILEQCIKLADPLLQEPKHVFPSTSEENDHVCKTIFPQMWSKYITCLKSFMANCLSSEQRTDLNRAVGDSINAVHKLCTNDDYKNAYLQSSSCIREKAVDVNICKPYYDQLVQHIQAPSSADGLCCAYDSFKMCILEETKECPCKNNICFNQNASHFAKVIVESSLGFLLKQCTPKVYVNTCNSYTPKRPRFETRFNENERFDGSTGYFPNSGPNIGNVQSERVPKESTVDNSVDKTTSPLTDVISPQNISSSVVANEDTGGFLWSPDKEIKDFDEFLKNTLQERQLASTSDATKLQVWSAVIMTMILTARFYEDFLRRA